MNKTLLPTRFGEVKTRGSNLRLFALLLLLMTVVGSNAAWAQLSYTYQLTRETYVPITYTNTHWTGNDIDDGTINNIATPFPFTFNDVTYNAVSISSNGALYFGPTGSTNISSTLSNQNNVVCAQCQDLRAGATGTAGSTTLGTAPNRIFVVEFTNWRRFGQTVPHDLNFQFRLYETTNEIEVHYGAHFFSGTSTFTAQAGIKGATVNDFIALTGTTDSAWVTATTGTGILSSIPYTQTTQPIRGLKYNFTPVPPANNDIAVQRYLNLPTVTNLCDSTEVRNLGVIIRNRGTAAIANASVNLEVFQGNTFITSEIVSATGSLAANTSDTLFFATVLLPSRGLYRFVASNGITDDVSANDTLRGTVNISRNCFDVPYTFRENLGTYTPLQNPTVVATTFNGQQNLITPPFPIVFNRRQYAQITINDNGQILLGNRTGFTTAFNPIASVNEVIVPLGFDQSTRSVPTFRSIKTEVVGSPGSRVFTIQYDSMSRAFFGALDLDYYNYQVKFDEATREITFAYGSFESSATEVSPLRPQVGMRINDSVFHHRSIVLNNTNWNENTRSLDNTATMILNSRLKPALGTEYIWTPTPGPAFDIAMIGAQLTQTGTNLCDSIQVSGGFVYSNSGFSPLSNAEFVITVRRAGNVEFRDTISSTRTLNEFENDTLFFGPYDANVLGAYLIQITPLLTDSDPSNNLVSGGFTIARDCRDIPYDFSESTAAFELLTNGTPVSPLTGLADNNNNTVNLPFPVFFGGNIFNQVTINTNGYMVFGPTNPNFGETNVLANVANVVAAFNLDAALDSGTFLTTGIQGPPNDPTFVIQWRNLEPWGTNATNDIRLTAQIRINRNTQAITLAYGESNYTSTTQLQTIGVAGMAINALTFHARTMFVTGGTWATTFRGGDNASALLFSAAVSPTSGQGFVFTPRGLPQNNVVARSILNLQPAVCINATNTPSLSFSNNAFGTLTAVPLRMRVVRPNGTPLPDVTLTAATNLEVGGADTVVLGGINFTDTGVYRITVISELAGDEARNNDTIRASVRVNPNLVYNLSAQGCAGSRSVLRINNAQNVRFFSDAARTQLLASDSLVVPSVPSTATTYFVSTGETNNLVATNFDINATNGGQVNLAGSTYGIVFNLTQPIGIQSAEVDAGGVGTFGWELVAANTTVPLYSGLITIAAAGRQRVSFNIPTLPIGNYWLRVTTQNVNLYRNFGIPAGTLPLAIPGGFGTIQSLAFNAASNTTYYFFYNVNLGSQICAGAGTFALNPIAAPAAPVVTLGGNSSICTGQTTVINGPSLGAGLTYRWSNGATTQNITVSAPGTYTLQAINAQGCVSGASNSVVITANPGPAAPVIANPSGITSLCPGERVVLRLPAGGSYIWSNNTTADSLVVTSAGSFTARVVVSGCTSVVSTPVAIAAGTQTAVTSISNITNASTVCPGETIELEAASSTAASYLWSNGATTRRISVTTPGAYTVQVTNAGQCLSPASVATVIAPGTPPAVGFTATVLAGGRRVALENLSVGGNNAQYRFNNTTLNTQAGRRDTIEFNADGTYTIELFTSNGCGADSVRETITITNVNNAALAKFITAYPNPATDKLNVNFGSLTFNKAVIQIMDVTGKEVSSTLVSGSALLNVADLKAALYTIKVTVDNQAPVFIQVVKQ